MNRKSIGLVVCFLSLLFVTFNCPPCAAQSERVIKVGHINPLSGPAAPWGLNTKCAMERFEFMFNEKWGGITVNGQKCKLKMFHADDKYSVAGGRAAAEKLIYTDKVEFIVGSFGAEPISGWAPLANKENILALIGGPTWSPRPDWPLTFRLSSSDNERSIALVKLMKEEYGCKSVLYLMSDDLVGKLAHEHALAEEKARGLDVLGYVMVPPKTKDYYPFLSDPLKKKPDFLFCKLPPGSVALVIKQARELGYKGKIGYPTSMPGNLKKWQAIAGVEASIGFIGIISNPAGWEQRTHDMSALIPKFCPGYESTDMAYSMQPDILMQAIEKVQSFDPGKIAEVLRTTEFHSLLKRPVRASGEKTYGIKNHISSVIPLAAVAGPEKFEFQKEYYIHTP